MIDTDPKKYRIKEHCGYFYPQFWHLLCWWDFKELVAYDCDTTVKYDNFDDANEFVKRHINNQESKRNQKIKNQEKPKYHKIQM